MNPWDNDPVVKNDTPWAADPVAGQQPQGKKTLTEIAIDAARSVPGGLAKGVAGIIGMPGDIANLANRGMDYLTGADVAKRNPSLVTSANVGRAVTAPFGGFYQPQTTPGKYAETVASFAPAAFGGEASIPARFARVAVPGVSSEAAGQATAGTKLEPYARIAGGLLGAALPPMAAATASYALPRALGATTGVGTRAIQEAYRAGSAGGSAADAFTGALRSETPSSDPVAMARSALAGLKADRSAAYSADRAALANDNSILDFSPVDSALAKLNAVKTFKGVNISESTAGVRQQVQDIVDFWKSLPPDQYHTPEGFDALKQKIWDDVVSTTQPGSTQRVVAKGAYDAVKDTIAKQAPIYSKMMGDYSNASTQLDELQNELSLKPNANLNTTLRKLQSIMRDNVNTAWGKRQQLGDILAAKQPDLLPSLAGQSLSASLPRGLARYGDASVLATLGAASHNPALLATLPFMMPRVVGEGAYAAGAANRMLSPLLAPLTHGYASGMYGSVPLSLSPAMAQ